MRIIGEFDKNDIKITVFKMNDRISIKFEKNLLEIIHKFRDGAGIVSVESAQAYCNEDLISQVQKAFSIVGEARNKSLTSMSESEGEKFPHIII